jgi:hypothetical protein
MQAFAVFPATMDTPHQGRVHVQKREVPFQCRQQQGLRESRWLEKTIHIWACVAFPAIIDIVLPRLAEQAKLRE